MSAGRRSARNRPPARLRRRLEDSRHRPIHGVEHRQQRQLHRQLITGVVPETASRWNRWRRPSSRISTATARSALSAQAIESFGSTSLVQVGNNYDLDSISSGTGPELQRGGAPVTVGQFAGWTPIGAEQTASGYDVAWKTPAPANTRCGAPTATATISRISSPTWRETAPRWKRWRRPSTRTSTATARSALSARRSNRSARPAWSRSATTMISTASAAAPAPNCNVAARP